MTDIEKNPFLDDTYEVPVKTGTYMKFEDGENRFRILARPVMGYEYWVDSTGAIQDRTESRIKGETYKPVRTKKGAVISPEQYDASKHFWAMPVWNYKTNQVEILQITQKTILQAIVTFNRMEEWGSPLGYDIQVFKKGTKLDTTYQVTPAPHKPLTEEQKKAFEDTPVNLEALFSGKDPFEKISEQEKEIIDILNS